MRSEHRWREAAGREPRSDPGSDLQKLSTGDRFDLKGRYYPGPAAVAPDIYNAYDIIGPRASSPGGALLHYVVLRLRRR
jgi:hypothetical protein